MKSLTKFLVVLIVIATGLGAAMLFRKQEAESDAVNASDADTASAPGASSDGQAPLSKSRPAVPLPADGVVTASGADSASLIPVPSGDSVAQAQTSQDNAIPPVRSTIRTPPVLPPAFPPYRPRELGTDVADNAEAAAEHSAPVRESIGTVSPQILPFESEVRAEPFAPAPVPNTVMPPAPSPNTVAAPPRPVETSKPAISHPPQLRTHQIVNGDTLARIARRYLGSDDRGMEILELNRDVLKDPQMLPLGRIIKIPPRETTAESNAARVGGTVLPLPPLVPLPPGALARP